MAVKISKIVPGVSSTIEPIHPEQGIGVAPDGFVILNPELAQGLPPLPNPPYPLPPKPPVVPIVRDHTLMLNRDKPNQHPYTAIEGLQEQLDSKAPVVHTHLIGQVVNLQTVLDGKSNIGHTHVPTEVGLGNVQNIKNNYQSNRNPSLYDDASDGYSVGSQWIDVSAQRAFVCVRDVIGMASWIETAITPTPVSITFIANVEPIGDKDGVNDTYTLPDGLPYLVESLTVYLNGAALQPNGIEKLGDLTTFRVIDVDMRPRFDDAFTCSFVEG